MSEHQPNPLDTYSMGFTHLSVKRGGKYFPIDRDTAAEEEVIAQSSAARSSILELPANTKGLNMERVQESLELFGASKKPILFLDSAHFNDALAKANYESSEPSGVYMEALGITLVQRDLALEALNGTAITESFGIHEGAHSTHTQAPIRLLHSKYGIWRKSAISASATPRVNGMTSEESLTPHFGSLFEEGYAEFERGLYVQNYDLVEQFTHGTENIGQFDASPIPLHYMYRTSPDELEHVPNITFPRGALAATVFEILMHQNDALLPTLRKSRHDSDALRQTQELIDNTMPGLYRKLQQPNEKAILDVLVEVIKEFGLPK